MPRLPGPENLEKWFHALVLFEGPHARKQKRIVKIRMLIRLQNISKMTKLYSCLSE